MAIDSSDLIHQLGIVLPRKEKRLLPRHDESAAGVVGMRRRTRFAQVPLGGEGIHGKAAVRGLR